MRDIELSVRGISYELNEFKGTDEEALAIGTDLYFNDDKGGENVDISEVEITWKSNEY